jgi:hypothetical protein
MAAALVSTSRVLRSLIGNEENGCDCQIENCVFEKLLAVLQTGSALLVATHTIAGY